MFWEELDDYPEVIRSSFSYVKAVSSDCLCSRCLISCLEAEGDSSVILICVGKRERVLQIEVAFLE